MSDRGDFTTDPTVVRHVGRSYREGVRITPGIPDGASGIGREGFPAARGGEPDPGRDVTVARAIIARAFITGMATGFAIAAVVLLLLAR